jgi:hypothetical protein
MLLFFFEELFAGEPFYNINTEFNCGSNAEGGEVCLASAIFILWRKKGRGQGGQITILAKWWDCSQYLAGNRWLCSPIDLSGGGGGGGVGYISLLCRYSSANIMKCAHKSLSMHEHVQIL